MALNKESQRNNGNFLKVKYGAISRTSKEPKEGYVEITVDNPSRPGEKVTKYVDKYPSLDGLIVAMKWYDTEQQYSTRFMGLKIKIRDEITNEIFYLDLPYGHRSYDTFTKLMENIDYSKPVEFNAFEDKKSPPVNGRYKTSFLVRQNGQVVRWKYLKSNMGDCPQPRAKKPTGWDFTEQKEWLFEKLINEVIPKVKELHPEEDFDEAEELGEYSEDETAEIENPDKLTQVKAETSPIATSLMDLVTAKQLGLIRAVARESGLDPEEECKKVYNCATDLLSKKAASAFIEYLNEYEAKPATPLVTTNTSGKIVHDPNDPDIPFGPGTPFPTEKKSLPAETSDTKTAAKTKTK